jgi:DNA-binding Xre family transcriptional regulator
MKKIDAVVAAVSHTEILEINLKDFAQKTGLSELTISKISKEISLILNIPI